MILLYYYPVNRNSGSTILTCFRGLFITTSSLLYMASSFLHSYLLNANLKTITDAYSTAVTIDSSTPNHDETVS